MGCIQKNISVFGLILAVIVFIGVSVSLIGTCSRSILFGQQVDNTDSRIANLITQLGAANFSDREWASKELLCLGEPAIIALTAAESGFAPEIRQRAAMIRGQIEQHIFRQTSESFLRSTEVLQSHELPGWKSFSSLVGTPRSSKLLFLEMVQEQRSIAKLVEALVSEKQRPQQDLVAIAACEDQLKVASGQCAERMRMMIIQKLIVPEVGDTVALMLAASVLEGQVPTEVHDIIYHTIIKSNFREAIRRPGYRECLLKLMGAWIPRTPEALSSDVLYLSELDGVPEGISVAKRVLSNGSTPTTVQAALHCLAKFGSEPDIQLAEKYLDDLYILTDFLEDGRDVLGIPRENAVPPGGRFQIQPAVPGDQRRMIVRMGDLALAVCMKLADQDLTRTFPRLTTSPDQDFTTEGLAFPFEKPDLREQAFKMWRDSRIAKQTPPAS